MHSVTMHSVTTHGTVRHVTRLVRSLSPVQNWLVDRVACYLERPREEINPAVPLAECGIDSVSALNLCGDIEDEWHIDVDPTLVYDYPTIADIAAYLETELAAAYRRAA